METDFIFWRHDTTPGIRIEEICGGEDKSDRLWKIMALQVFGENGDNRYREIDHQPSGAPLLDEGQQRISLSHTCHFMVVAFLPRTPEADLMEFNLRTALGVDTERADRTQVLRVAPRVLSPEELLLVDEYARTLPASPDDSGEGNADPALVKASILAWTVKEALYKAALHEGLDFRNNLIIESLPEICDNPLARNPRYGKAVIMLPVSGSDGKTQRVEMELFSYISEGNIVTLAYSPKCAKFRKS